jgi:hypothetical protein
MATVMVWSSQRGLLLHPDFSAPRRCWKSSTRRLKHGRQAAGRWWPVLCVDGIASASELPDDAVEGNDEPVVVPPAGHEERRPPCELRKASPPPRDDTPLLNSHQVRDMLRSEKNTYDPLASQYADNLNVRRAVVEALAVAPDGSEELTNACLIAARVADPSLWEGLAYRAKRANPVAEACLREISDERGVVYFTAAFRPEADAPLGSPLLRSALGFFFKNCIDQGLDYITTALGHPFFEPTRTNAQRWGRLIVGEALQSGQAFRGLDVRSEWCDYVAACLLVEKFPKDEAWMASKAIELLLAYRDPRTPIVMHRLIRDKIYDEDDVVPALTVFRNQDAARTTRALLAETCAARARARGEEADRLEYLEELLRRAADELGLEA